MSALGPGAFLCRRLPAPSPKCHLARRFLTSAARPSGRRSIKGRDSVPAITDEEHAMPDSGASDAPKGDLKEAALAYHRQYPPGKLAVVPTKPLANQRDLALAYSPGVAAALEV